MEVSVPIQSNPATLGQGALLAQPTGGGGLADIFAALLSGLLPNGDGPQTPPPVGTTLPESQTNPSDSLKNPVGQVQPLPVGQVQPLPVGQVQPLPVGQAQPLPVGQAQPVPMGQVQPLPVGQVQPLPVDQIQSLNDNVLIAELTGSATALPAGKDSADKVPTHARTGKGSDQETAPAIQSQIDPGGPGIMLTALGLVSQAETVQVSPQSSVLMPPPASGTSVTSAPHVRGSSAQKSAEPHNAAPASPRGEQPAEPNHLNSAGIPAASSVTDGKPEKFAVKSNVVSEAAALSMRSDVPQALASGPDSSAAPPLNQGQDAPAIDRAAPNDQIAHVLVGMLKTTEGTQSVIVRLQPSELGQVQIRIDRTIEGVAHVDITADRPETLQLLQRDEPRLQQALDLAGVPSNGRSVSFQVTAPDQVGASASRPDSMATGSGGSGQGQSGGAWRENSDTQHNSGRGSGSDQGQARARWFRAGLDITA